MEMHHWVRSSVIPYNASRFAPRHPCVDMHYFVIRLLIQWYLAFLLYCFKPSDFNRCFL